MIAQPLDDNLVAAIGAMFEQEGGDDQAEHDGAGMDADCTGADDDAESTLEMASNAGVKDPGLCTFPSCVNVRMPKHAKRKEHRKLFENALSDATPDEATLLKNMSYDELEDIFEKRARAGAGPPGRGSKTRSYDYAKVFQEKKSSFFNQGRVVCEPVTHFRFMKRMAEEKIGWRKKLTRLSGKGRRTKFNILKGTFWVTTIAIAARQLAAKGD